MFPTRCPHCRQGIELGDDRRGKPVRCPLCSQAFRAPLFEDDEALAPAGPSNRADTTLLVASLVGGLGVITVGGAILAQALGNNLHLPPQLLTTTTILPAVLIGLSWVVGRKATRIGLISTARILGYLWLLGQVYLLLQTMKAAVPAV